MDEGAMEAIVKITKKVLKTVVRDSLFTEEMLAIYLTEIESHQWRTTYTDH